VQQKPRNIKEQQCSSLFLGARSVVRLVRDVLDSLKTWMRANLSRWMHVWAAPPGATAPSAKLLPHFAHSFVRGDATKALRVCAKALPWPQDRRRAERPRSISDMGRNPVKYVE
jgi:hypothetical protein